MPAPPGPGRSPSHPSVHGAPLPTVPLKPVPAACARHPRAEPAKPSALRAAAPRCLHRSQDDPGLPPLPPGAAAQHVGLQDQGTGDKRAIAGPRSGPWSEGSQRPFYLRPGGSLAAPREKMLSHLPCLDCVPAPPLSQDGGLLRL